MALQPHPPTPGASPPAGRGRAVTSRSSDESQAQHRSERVPQRSWLHAVFGALARRSRDFIPPDASSPSPLLTLCPRTSAAHAPNSISRSMLDAMSQLELDAISRIPRQMRTRGYRAIRHELPDPSAVNTPRFTSCLAPHSTPSPGPSIPFASPTPFTTLPMLRLRYNNFIQPGAMLLQSPAASRPQRTDLQLKYMTDSKATNGSHRAPYAAKPQ